MKQQKLEVIINGEIDVMCFEKVFFETLFNRIAELAKQNNNG